MFSDATLCSHIRLHRSRRRWYEQPLRFVSLRPYRCSLCDRRLWKRERGQAVAPSKKPEQTKGPNARQGIFGAVLTAVLLAPVPVFATINFSGVKWTPSQPALTPLFTDISYSSNSNDTLLTFYLAQGTTTFASGTTTVVSSAIPATGSDTLKSTWGKLTDLQVSTGSVTVSITVTNGTPGNMFSATYTTTPSSDSPATINVGSFTADPVVTVKFDYSSSVTVTQSNPSTFFTLDFTNGP